MDRLFGISLELIEVVQLPENTQEVMKRGDASSISVGRKIYRGKKRR